MCMCSIDIKRDQVCDRTASWEGTSIEERATGWRTSSLVRTHIHILEIVTIAIVVQHTVSATHGQSSDALTVSETDSFSFL